MIRLLKVTLENNSVIYCYRIEPGILDKEEIELFINHGGSVVVIPKQKIIVTLIDLDQMLEEINKEAIENIYEL